MTDSGEPNPSPRVSPPARRPSWPLRLLGVGGLAVGLLFATDATLGWWFGLGRPVRLLADAEMEYRLAPDQATTRRGSRIEINGLGMRSSNFPAERGAATGLRVLVLGDSVLFGGAATDQAELATEILADRLSSRLGSAVEVGNASAGSWGPANWRGFLRRHGSLDADLVVVVASSHDAADTPTRDWTPPPPLNPALPALHELWRRLNPPQAPASAPARDAPAPGSALPDLDLLLEEVERAGTPVRVLPFFTRSEASRGASSESSAQIRQRALRTGTPPDLAEPVARGDWTADAYRDELHPNSVGQRILADRLELLVLAWLDAERL